MDGEVDGEAQRSEKGLRRLATGRRGDGRAMEMRRYGAENLISGIWAIQYESGLTMYCPGDTI